MLFDKNWFLRQHVTFNVGLYFETSAVSPGWLEVLIRKVAFEHGVDCTLPLILKQATQTATEQKLA